MRAGHDADAAHLSVFLSSYERERLQREHFRRSARLQLSPTPAEMRAEVVATMAVMTEHQLRSMVEAARWIGRVG